jgi:hypothetical protein
MRRALSLFLIEGTVKVRVLFQRSESTRRLEPSLSVLVGIHIPVPLSCSRDPLQLNETKQIANRRPDLWGQPELSIARRRCSVKSSCVLFTVKDRPDVGALRVARGAHIRVQWLNQTPLQLAGRTAQPKRSNSRRMEATRKWGAIERKDQPFALSTRVEAALSWGFRRDERIEIGAGLFGGTKTGPCSLARRCSRTQRDKRASTSASTQASTRSLNSFLKFAIWLSRDNSNDSRDGFEQVSR